MRLGTLTLIIIVFFALSGMVSGETGPYMLGKAFKEMKTQFIMGYNSK